MKISITIGIIATILMATACTTTDPAAPASETASSVKKKPTEIVRGMTQEEILAILGEPEKKEVATTEDVTRENWHYTFIVRRGVDMVQTDTRMVPYIDPLSGEMREIPEAILSPQSTVIKQSIQLLFEGGLVISWKSQITEDVGYN